MIPRGPIGRGRVGPGLKKDRHYNLRLDTAKTNPMTKTILESRQISIILRDIAAYFECEWKWKTHFKCPPEESELLLKVQAFVNRHKELCNIYSNLTGETYGSVVSLHPEIHPQG